MAFKMASSFLQTVTETPLAATFPGLQNQNLQQKAFNTSHTLDATTTPAATKVITQKPLLSSGTLVIDLTAAIHLGVAVDLTGLKLREILFNNIAANAVTITADGTNGYLLFGASGSVIVPAGGILHFFPNDGAPAVGASTKRSLLTGTGAQQFELQMVFG